VTRNRSLTIEIRDNLTVAEVLRPPGRSRAEAVIENGHVGTQFYKRRNDIDSAPHRRLMECGRSVLGIDVEAEFDQTANHIAWLVQLGSDANEIGPMCAHQLSLRWRNGNTAQTPTGKLFYRTHLVL
jgi:hypothetical protein